MAWTTAPETVLRTYETAGVPASGFHNISKTELAALFQAFGSPIETLTADREYFCNPATGSDLNSGATALTAFQTPQAIGNAAAALNMNGHFVQGTMADGDYAQGCVLIRPLIGSPVNGLHFEGNGSNPENVRVSVPAGYGFAAFNGARLKVSNCKIAAVYNLYSEDAGSKIAAANIISNGVAVGNSVHVYARRAGEIEIKAAPIFFYGSGTPDALFQATHRGIIWLEDAAMQIAENITVVVANAYALSGGEVVGFGASLAWSGAGTVTGKRHVSRAAVIQVIGQTTSFFPGSIAGTTPDNGVFLTAAT